RLLMLRKGIPDIRLLRASDPRVASQMFDLAKVPGVACHCVGREAEGVVVVGQGNNSGATGQAHLAAPGRSEGGRRKVDDQLDGMTARSRIGEVADGEVTGELVGRKDGGHSCSSGERADG